MNKSLGKMAPQQPLNWRLLALHIKLAEDKMAELPRSPEPVGLRAVTLLGAFGVGFVSALIAVVLAGWKAPL